MPLPPDACPDCGGRKVEGIGIIPRKGKELCQICSVRDACLKKDEAGTEYDMRYLIAASSLITFDQYAKS